MSPLRHIVEVLVLAMNNLVVLGALVALSFFLELVRLFGKDWREDWFSRVSLVILAAVLTAWLSPAFAPRPFWAWSVPPELAALARNLWELVR